MKSIKIPKTDCSVWVEILKRKTERYRLCLSKQEICGLIIPKDSTIDVDVSKLEFNANGNKVSVEPYNINKLLRFVYLEKLRKGEL